MRDPRGTQALRLELRGSGVGTAASGSDRWSCGGRPEVCVFDRVTEARVSRGAGLLGVPNLGKGVVLNPGEDAAPTPDQGSSL